MDPRSPSSRREREGIIACLVATLAIAFRSRGFYLGLGLAVRRHAQPSGMAGRPSGRASCGDLQYIQSTCNA